MMETSNEQATRGAKSDAEAIALLGVTKATFYSRKRQFKNLPERTN
jgi:hypothetical protein